MNKNTSLILRYLLACILLISFNVSCSFPNQQTGKVEIKKTYYPNGKLKLESSYKNNSLHGTSKLYRESGELWKEINYVNSKKDGISKTYHSGDPLPIYAKLFNGDWEEENYKNGKLDGFSTTYNKNGYPRIQVTYESGQIKNLTSFEDGYPTYTIYYKFGKANKLTTYYSMSILRHPYQECDGRQDGDNLVPTLHGICKTYYESGEIQYIDTYKNGNKLSRKAFNEEGKLKFEQNY